MATAPPLPVAPGDVVDGRYRLGRLLGQGGVGAVFEGEHLILRNKLAIKFLVDTSAGSPEARVRFAREAQIAARLKSPYAVRVTDVATPVDGPAYLVMELLSGCDLEKLVLSRGPLPLATAIDYTLQACDALAEAHALGVVHRDLKPANLFLAENTEGAGVVKVLDFGLSKWADGEEGSPTVTSTTSVMGSPAYMSPEQLRSSKHVDRRTDVWSLAATLYQLLTGALPFQFTSLSELLAAIARDPYIPARSRQPHLPADVDAFFARCFQKDPERRYADMIEVARALAPLGDSNAAARVATIEARVNAAATPARAAIVETGAVSPEATTQDAFSATGARKPIARRRAVLAAGGVLLLAAGTLALARTITRAPTESIVPAAAASAVTTPAEVAATPNADAAVATAAPESNPVIAPKRSTPTGKTRIRNKAPAPSSAGTPSFTPATTVRE